MRRSPAPAARPGLTVLVGLLVSLAFLGAGTVGATPVSATAVSATVAATSDGSTPDETMLTVPSADPAPSDTANDFVDLERDLSECVGNALPKPGCGRAPTHSGDRGSAMQWAVFGLMAAGIGFIGWRIVAGARRTRVG